MITDLGDPRRACVINSVEEIGSRGWIGENADPITLSGEGQPQSFPPPDDCTPEEKPPMTFLGVLKPAAYFAGVIALLMGFLTVLMFYSIYHELSLWPHAQADVDRCEVYLNNQPAEAPTYGLRCNLTYTADSRVWHAQTGLGYYEGSRPNLNRWALRIRRGDKVEIAYDPSDHSRVHFAGDSSLAYAAPLRSLTVVEWFGFGSIIAFILWNKFRPVADASYPSGH